MEIRSPLPDVIASLETQSVKDGIQKRVVGAVITDRGKILIVTRSQEDDFLPGYAEIPGGGVNDGESLAQALCREIQEETGLKPAKILDYLGSFDYLSSSGKKARQFNFLVECERDHVKLNPKEHSSYAWVSAQDDTMFNAMRITPEMRVVIRNICLP